MSACRDITPDVLSTIRDEWERAGRGHKKGVVQRWADHIGVTVPAIYKALPSNQQQKATRRIEGIEAATRIVAQFKFSAPDHRRQKVTEDAVRLAVMNGAIDKIFLDVPASSFDRIMRQLNLSPKKPRKERFQALRPNQLHHIDGSTSDGFYIAERLPDGDYLLKLHKGHKDYKNKPVPVNGLRPWYYGYVDDYSGCWTARIVAACGESALDNIQFLCWAWSEETGLPWCGIPERLMGDKGPMIRSAAVKEFLDRTGVTVEKTMPGNKDAHGKIEKIWDVIWQRFEATYFIGDWQKFTITLSELNRQLLVFAKRWSSTSRHRYEKQYTRLQMWERINLHGGAVLFPTDAIKTVVRSYERTLDQCGCCTIDGVTFEVKGLHSAKVRIIRGALDNRMVAQDLQSGNKYEVVDFRPNDLDEFRGNAKTEHEKVREQAVNRKDAQNFLHMEDDAPIQSRQGAATVHKMPIRKATRTIADPLEINKYGSLNEALSAFQGLSGCFLNPEDRKSVGKLIVENELSKRYVSELATDVIMSLEAATA